METITIQDIDKYNQKIIGGNLVLIPKKTYIDLNTFKKQSLSHSTIISCEIKDKDKEISRKTKYSRILYDIWKPMRVQKILKETSFIIILANEVNAEEKARKSSAGFISELNMHIQTKSAQLTMKEILRFVDICKLTIDISIQLDTYSVINYKNY